MPGGRPKAAKAFNTLVPLVGGVFHRGEQFASVTQPVLPVWGEKEDTLLLMVTRDRVNPIMSRPEFQLFTVVVASGQQRSGEG